MRLILSYKKIGNFLDPNTFGPEKTTGTDCREYGKVEVMVPELQHELKISFSCSLEVRICGNLSDPSSCTAKSGLTPLMLFS